MPSSRPGHCKVQVRRRPRRKARPVGPPPGRETSVTRTCRWMIPKPLARAQRRQLPGPRCRCGDPLAAAFASRQGPSLAEGHRDTAAAREMGGGCVPGNPFSAKADDGLTKGRAGQYAAAEDGADASSCCCCQRCCCFGCCCSRSGCFER